MPYMRCPCPHKVGYRRLSDALLACDGVRRRFEARPYSCVCGRYHLTTNGGRNQKKKSREK